MAVLTCKSIRSVTPLSVCVFTLMCSLAMCMYEELIEFSDV